MKRFFQRPGVLQVGIYYTLVKNAWFIVLSTLCNNVDIPKIRYFRLHSVMIQNVAS